MTNTIQKKTISIDEFRNWLNMLIQDKKGALPNLADWKMIKEQLDKVENQPVDDGDYSGDCLFLESDIDEVGRCTGFDPHDYNDAEEQCYDPETINRHYDENGFISKTCTCGADEIDCRYR